MVFNRELNPQRFKTSVLQSRFSHSTYSNQTPRFRPSRSQLTDGATPIVIIDTDEILESLQRATAAASAAAAATAHHPDSRERIQKQAAAADLYETDDSSTDEASN